MSSTASRAALTAACLAGACLSTLAVAQGALKPVDALIVNPPNRPVPVSVVPAAAPATAMCRIEVTTEGSLLPIPGGGSARRMDIVECTEGVTRLDVQRVVFSTGTGISPPSFNQVHYTVSLGLGRSLGSAAMTLDAPIATLSSGAPDVSLGRPVRIDKTAAGVFLVSAISCSSGLAGVQPLCGGTVFMIGTPVP